MGQKVLISAGEASGDLYAAGLVEALRRRNPGLEFFGCAGPRMQRAGVRAVVDAASIAVVGLVEVVTHIPRVYREYRKQYGGQRKYIPKAPEDGSDRRQRDATEASTASPRVSNRDGDN